MVGGGEGRKEGKRGKAVHNWSDTKEQMVTVPAASHLQADVAYLKNKNGGEENYLD